MLKFNFKKSELHEAIWIYFSTDVSPLIRLTKCFPSISFYRVFDRLWAQANSGKEGNNLFVFVNISKIGSQNHTGSKNYRPLVNFLYVGNFNLTYFNISMF